MFSPPEKGSSIKSERGSGLRWFYDTRWLLLILAIVLGCILVWPLGPKPAAVLSSLGPVLTEEGHESIEPILPIPLRIVLDPKKVSLGESLFHDPGLSGDGSIACASCHNLNTAGVDGLSVAVGIKGRLGNTNTPTVFNSGFSFRQFWDGRAKTLEAQIDGPLHNVVEMASSWPKIIAKLEHSPAYVSSFSASYEDGITSDNIKDAITTFERSLYTPNSRFDQFLRGDKNAITAEEHEGYRLFKRFGCASCHQGVNVGGNMYQRFGVMVDYFSEGQRITEVDRGHYNVTRNEADKHLFKVPSLRLAALTPPYFHDGSAATLEGAIAIMGWYQLRRRLQTHEIALIVKFLQTLPGEYNGAFLIGETVTDGTARQ